MYKTLHDSLVGLAFCCLKLDIIDGSFYLLPCFLSHHHYLSSFDGPPSYPNSPSSWTLTTKQKHIIVHNPKARDIGMKANPALPTVFWFWHIVRTIIIFGAEWGGTKFLEWLIGHQWLNFVRWINDIFKAAVRITGAFFMSLLLSVCCPGTFQKMEM